MADKEQRLIEELQKCQENIQRTKELISYHKDMLRKQEKKAEELSNRIDKEKMNSLFHLINEGGYDIDTLRQAVSTGRFETVSAKSPDIKPEEKSIQPTKAEIISAVSERKDKK